MKRNKITDHQRINKMKKNLCTFIRYGWRWILCGALAGAFIAGLYIAKCPKKYEASAFLIGAKLNGTNIESPQIIVERLKQPNFYSIDENKTCGVEDRDGSKKIAARLGASVLKGTDVVKLSYNSENDLIAKKCVEVVAAKILAMQDKTIEIETRGIEMNIRLTQAQIAKLEWLQSKTMEALSDKIRHTGSSENSAILFSLLQAYKQGEIEYLRARLMDQRVRLEPPITRSGSLIGAVVTSETSPYSMYFLLMAAGVGTGTMLGVLFVYFRKVLSGTKIFSNAYDRR